MEQKTKADIWDDFQIYWLDTIRNKHKFLDRFNYIDIAINDKVLDIGAGTGNNITASANKNYYALELREKIAKRIKTDYPNVTAVIGDCEKKLTFPDRFFDKVIASNILEHLHNLDSTLLEVSRTLKTDGTFFVIIPIINSITYNIGMRLITKRAFEKKYKTSYLPFIRSQHINSPNKIIRDLKKYFIVTKKEYFPFNIPFNCVNIFIKLHLKVKI
ncbi:class I SAM-dependent methyltransferase [Candidatus Pacearchaeota archaeon]|nr:class I SAM-dependent methyltransferase [Candidatus Pacearchaeota archaeon]